jgi:hypothetical protein
MRETLCVRQTIFVEESSIEVNGVPGKVTHLTSEACLPATQPQGGEANLTDKASRGSSLSECSRS